MHDKLDVLPVDVKIEIFKRVILIQIMGLPVIKKNSNKKMAFMED